MGGLWPVSESGSQWHESGGRGEEPLLASNVLVLADLLTLAEPSARPVINVRHQNCSRGLGCAQGCPFAPATPIRWKSEWWQ